MLVVFLIGLMLSTERPGLLLSACSLPDATRRPNPAAAPALGPLIMIGCA